MIDHVLGRPSVRFRKTQVLAVVSFWSLYLLRGHRHGPPVLRSISNKLTPRLTVWQCLVVTMLWLYVARNFGKLLGLECPEPLANLYTRSFFRATWVTTALDAGFWTAMRIRRPWLRNLASMVFSIYYLFAAEQADEKARKVRGTLTVDHLRISWNKGTTPYLALLGNILRPKLTRYPPRAIRIPRPRQSSYSEPVNAWLYFDGPISALTQHRNVVLDIPGGGFVAMDPRAHDDKLLAWAGKTGLPVLSLDYRKAPEYPYPYALNECYDVYHSLIASRGRCLGLSGEHAPRIVVTGDSAGGNLATAVVLMIVQAGSTDSRRWHGEAALPPPTGLILIYPALDMNIGNWMTEEQMELIKDRKMRKTNRPILRRKSEDYTNLTPDTPHPSDDDNDETSSPPRSGILGTGPHPSTARLVTSPISMIGGPIAQSLSVAEQADAVASGKPQQLKTRLAMSSIISYFNDRILTPEMMRAMIILYIGPHNRPDFATDFLLSPLLAPESLLADFPPTYFQTGERDPLVDDTVIFAGRIGRAKHTKWIERKELGLLPPSSRFDERDHVEVALVPGISHGFLQFAGVFPEGWKCIFRCARWMNEIFEKAEEHDVHSRGASSASTRAGGSSADTRRRHHRRVRTESSGDEDRPLEMMMMSSSASSNPSSTINGALSLSSMASAAIRTTAAESASRPRSGPSSRSNDRSHHRTRSHPRRHRRHGDRGDADYSSDEEEEGETSSAEVGTSRLRRSRKNRRNASTVSLASEEDLLGRRMNGLAGGLMGMTSTTPTSSSAKLTSGNGRRWETQTSGATGDDNTEAFNDAVASNGGPTDADETGDGNHGQSTASLPAASSHDSPTSAKSKARSNTVSR
ncbi:MAG: hypothetical protein M1815_005511 [Lichina confinis]|nr:MAG: hypothetical protein M1815_005511 [Lichina confinis]